VKVAEGLLGDVDTFGGTRGRCECHTGGGERAQVEGPLAGRALPPQREGVTAVGLSLLVGHARDGAQVSHCLLGLALDLRESEMGDGVAMVAQADQAAQRLDPGRFVVDPAFVCLQLSPGRWVGRSDRRPRSVLLPGW
jgi:hypothetical protein